MIHFTFFDVLLVGLASIAIAYGQFERATILLGNVDPYFPAWGINQIAHSNTYDPDIATVRTQLGESAFAAAWEIGKAMTRRQAIKYALEASDDPPVTLPVPVADNQLLTDRELEILQLLVNGLNSREIAQELVLSVGTIRWYLKLIYSKLDAHSRSEALARAKELKLLV